ncbi:MAG TPA: hypothetical protein VKW08_07425 [Xanthobacteraceae bacterium]|nr:hypothetical protein [Xanthobacteraceae bacterium]
MKKLSIIAAAFFIGLSGVAMAGQDSQQGDTNSTGPNPYMPEFSTPVTHGDADLVSGNARSAFGYSIPHQAPHRQIKR